MVEYELRELFQAYKLPVHNRVLFHGPTGTGKTTIAKEISKLSGLPFIQIKSESVINSSMGASGKNISDIFNNIKEPCILFWDEIDSVGMKRIGGGKDGASVENERIVNSILVHIDNLSTDVIFIAATNRLEVLDSAFLRRFDIKHKIGLPTDSDKIAYLEKLSSYHGINLNNAFNTINPEIFTSLAEIKQMYVSVSKKKLIKKQNNGSI